MSLNRVVSTHKRAEFRTWFGLLILMLPVLLVTVDNTILGFALPKIARALEPSANQQLWIIDAYSLVLAGLLVSMGNIGDRVGHRLLLLSGSLGFTIVSVMTALSSSPEQLIAGRAALGFFGAMLMPSTLALISHLFTDREQRRLAIAIWATTLTVGSALGPVIGGVLLQYFNWQAIFLLAVPVLVPLLVFAPILLPESDKKQIGVIDGYSVLLSIIAMAGIVYAIKHVASDGFEVSVIVEFAIGLIAGTLFIRRQQSLQIPLMDISLFRNGAFTGSIIVNLLSLGLLIGFVFFATQYLQIVLNMKPLAASLALVPGQIMAIVFGMVIVPIAQRVPSHWLVPLLLALAGTAFLLIACVGSNLTSIVIAFALLSIGVGAIASVSNDLVLSAVPSSKAGAASAISETAYEVGVVFGTTILGGLVTAFYRLNLQLPKSISQEQAGLALETLAGAYVIAASLIETEGRQLMDAAAHSFTSAIHITSWLTVVLAGCVVLMASYLLRKL
ncbi:MFS transporter [Xenorhabdus bovienii]|uniref:Putative methyl viologen resistance protein (MFS superfamily) n=2 Tax=Xenorhabdus bovienii TaxID=40576 RepID=A0A0B6XDJ6_XENBV|nr:MFS transporter [Xenorhabdus bovienii]CDG95967.1 putative methyl viologen resistance protein (MFS superfamily) [Xenorhabdus bovienii str. puntauvense]CDM91226.1 putative methyl viologen resistance protein (MFS superfamily) [Xenorhabdus bovienii]